MVSAPVTVPDACGIKVIFAGAACPGVKVIPEATPVALNPEPTTVTPEIVTFAVPVFVSVKPSAFVPPTTMLPKSSDVAVELRAGTAATAVPVTPRVSGELEASLAMETLPLRLPGALGAYVTVKTEFCPGVMTELAATPVAVSPEPRTVTPKTLRLALPALVSVIVKLLVLPTVTLPKFSAVALAVRTGVGDAIALPLAATVSGEFGASLTTEIVPLELPEAVGEKTTLKLTDCPFGTYAGRFRPVTLNPVPVTLICEIVAWAVPVFEIVTSCELLEPATTFWKLAVVGETANCACPPGFGDGDGSGDGLLLLVALTTPAQPYPMTAAAIAAAANSKIDFEFPLSDPALAILRQV